MNAREVSLKEFNQSINSLTMTFIKQKMEAQYQSNRVETVKGVFKIGLVISLIVMFLRRLDIMILSLLNIEALTHGFNNELFLFLLMLGAGSVELIFFFVKAISKLRGMAGMIYIFFSVGFASRSALDSVPSSTPT